MRSPRITLALAAVLLLGYALRLQRAGLRLPYVYPDEWLYTGAAMEMLEGRIPDSFAARHPGSPIYLMLTVLYGIDREAGRLLGTGPTWEAYRAAFEDGGFRAVLILRILAATCWILGLIVGFRLLKPRTGPALALGALLVLATSPPLVQWGAYGNLAEAYAIPLILILTGLGIRIAREGALPTYVAAGTVVGAATAVKYPFISSVAIVVFAHTLAPRDRDRLFEPGVGGLRFLGGVVLALGVLLLVQNLDGSPKPDPRDPLGVLSSGFWNLRAVARKVGALWTLAGAFLLTGHPLARRAAAIVFSRNLVRAAIVAVFTFVVLYPQILVDFRGVTLAIATELRAHQPGAILPEGTISNHGFYIRQLMGFPLGWLLAPLGLLGALGVALRGEKALRVAFVFPLIHFAIIGFGPLRWTHYAFPILYWMVAFALVAIREAARHLLGDAGKADRIVLGIALVLALVQGRGLPGLIRQVEVEDTRRVYVIWRRLFLPPAAGIYCEYEVCLKRDPVRIPGMLDNGSVFEVMAAGTSWFIFSEIVEKTARQNPETMGNRIEFFRRLRSEGALVKSFDPASLGTGPRITIYRYEARRDATMDPGANPHPP